MECLNEYKAIMEVSLNKRYNGHVKLITAHEICLFSREFFEVGVCQSFDIGVIKREP